MAKLKIYKVRSNQARIIFNLGEVSVEGNFVNGNIRENKWAKLSTSDPLAQFVIERSPMFNKTVFLDSCVEIEEERKIDVEEVFTINDARKYFSQKYGEDVRTLASPNSIKSRMKRYNVVFPNLSI